MATLNVNIASASETEEGIIEIATQAETNTGADDLKALTPKKLADSDLAGDVVTNNAKVGITAGQASDITDNNAKNTNATHTAEVTGSGALTVNKTAISNKALVTAVAGDHVLIGDASNSNNLKKVNVSDFLGGGTDTIIYQYTHSSGTNLSDTSDFFIMFGGTTMGNTNNSSARAPIASGKVVRVDIVSYVAGTFGTSEDSTVTFEHSDGASSDVISSVVKFDARNNLYSITGLSIDVVAGFSWIKLDTPVFVTNPTGAKIAIILYMEL